MTRQRPACLRDPRPGPASPTAGPASGCCSCCRPRCCLFLTYPLGLGVWLAFTDTTIGRPGVFVGLENYEFLWVDSVFWLSVFNTILYTAVASVLKFALGLWLALLLNRNLPFKAFFRAIVLLPWVVPTVLSAIAFWWIYDASSRSSPGR